MNQILLTNNDKNNDKSSKRKSNIPTDMKKIIIFFGIVILVFGIAIACLYAYNLHKNSKPEEKIIGKPELSLEYEEGMKEVIIKAKSEIGISKIIYNWNDGENVELPMEGRTSNEESIEIPNGENILTVKVIDKQGQENEATESFNVSNSENKPVIEVNDKVGNGKIKITATDETGMQYITYKWNDEEETIAQIENEGDTKIEIIIDAKRGNNTLNVKAVNMNNNEETLEKIYKGVNKPVIDVWQNGRELHMKITHDMGFQKVQFTVNGKEYNYDENYSKYDANEKELEYKFDLQEGENTVVITALSNENTEAIYRGKCNYTVED